nr:hypothetical protein [Kibdelosporangium sp. MJ126-NF4]CEL13836.1 hypothetical protein [Kibdelosporangium sp. MJ126-NF4]CTQ88204.1 hypothetical protein [Kibdelosporangium sp. MJ126-NF4]
MRITVAVVLLLLTGVAACGGPAGTQTTGFVELGPLRGNPRLATELTGNAGDTMYQALRQVSTKDIDQARELLTRPQPGGGTRSFAFVKPGCAETGAAPTLTDNVIGVRLTGGENTNCAQANYFLVTVEAEDPENRLRLPA